MTGLIKMHSTVVPINFSHFKSYHFIIIIGFVNWLLNGKRDDLFFNSTSSLMADRFHYYFMDINSKFLAINLNHD